MSFRSPKVTSMRREFYDYIFDVVRYTLELRYLNVGRRPTYMRHNSDLAVTSLPCWDKTRNLTRLASKSKMIFFKN